MLCVMTELTLKEWTVLMRKHCAPDPGMTNAKPSTCRDCGEVFWQWKRQYKKRCADCAGELIGVVTVEQHGKSGEHYEKAVIGAFRYWSREARRLGLSLDVDD